jgi:hypothetical protein
MVLARMMPACLKAPLYIASDPATEPVWDNAAVEPISLLPFEGTIGLRH